MDGSLGSENGPILYNEPNRTSAIDDIRSVVIYIFIITIFFSFFLILPGIRNDKFPTFLCITTSLFVASIILISLFGTTWHVGEAPISAAYKAFSRDRIQGELSVNIGLQSVNITLRAHKYYILHDNQGPLIMYNVNIIPQQQQQQESSTINKQSSPLPAFSAKDAPDEEETADVEASLSNERGALAAGSGPGAGSNLASELSAGRTSDGASVDTELEVEDVFPDNSGKDLQASARRTRSSASAGAQSTSSSSSTSGGGKTKRTSIIRKRSSLNQKRRLLDELSSTSTSSSSSSSVDKRGARRRDANRDEEKQFISENSSNKKPLKFTIEHVNIDINYNERFYFIEPNQMRQEHQNALERGLPYPILTVVEYLSQDEAGFSWSRQYRAAGYYSYIMLWLSFCVCVLMFILHCAAPKYGIYTMQLLGLLLILTNFTYATLVPKGDRKLVIPFEGQPLTFKYGWNFWFVLIGGLTSLFVGTIIVVIDFLFPNFIFTTILDVDFDSHHKYYKHVPRHRNNTNANNANNNININTDSRGGDSASNGSYDSRDESTKAGLFEKRRLKRPLFFEHNNSLMGQNDRASHSSGSPILSLASSSSPSSTLTTSTIRSGAIEASHKGRRTNNNNFHSNGNSEAHSAGPTGQKARRQTATNDSEMLSSTVTTTTTTTGQDEEGEGEEETKHHYYHKSGAVGVADEHYGDVDATVGATKLARRKTTTITITGKNANLKSMHQQASSSQLTSNADDGDNFDGPSQLSRL